MNRKQEAKAIAALSPRARVLFSRIKEDRRFYRSWGRTPPPKAMAELVKAGLVMESGRVVLIGSYFVPVRGFKSFKTETWAQ